MIAGHNLLDGIRPATARLTMLHGQASSLNGPHVVFVAYPLIPWIGVTAAGFGLGGSTTGRASAGGRSCCAPALR